MNCPACKVMVGNDQFHADAWKNEIDAGGTIVGCIRDLYIACSFCGLFHCVQEFPRAIRTIHAVNNDKDRRRIERKIPGARFAEVCA